MTHPFRARLADVVDAHTAHDGSIIDREATLDALVGTVEEIISEFVQDELSGPCTARLKRGCATSSKTSLTKRVASVARQPTEATQRDRRCPECRASTAKQRDPHMAPRAERPVPPVDEPVHARTGAKKTNTPEAPTARPAPSVPQVLAAQKAPPSNRQAAASTALTPVTAPTSPTARSHEAFLKNAGEMGGGIPTITHHGIENVFMCDGCEMPKGTQLVVHYPEAQHGYRQWHGAGVVPTIILRPPLGRTGQADAGRPGRRSRRGHRLRRPAAPEVGRRIPGADGRR
jgi:hypothetical protein